MPYIRPSCRTLLALCSLVAVSALASCSGKTLSADVLDPPIQRVLDRHDTYVILDTSLSDVERSTYLRSSKLVRTILDESMGRKQP